MMFKRSVILAAALAVATVGLRADTREQSLVDDPRIFGLLTESGAFSILDPYLRLAAAGETILPFRVDDFTWVDIGRPEQLQAAHAAAARLDG